MNTPSKSGHGVKRLGFPGGSIALTEDGAHGNQPEAYKPFDQWSHTELERLPLIANGVSEEPDQRLRRWRSLFAEELTEVHRLARRAAVSDIELKQWASPR